GVKTWYGAATPAAAAGAPASKPAAKNERPPDATALCADGTYSKAESQRGACSSHGGVKTWYGAAIPPSASARSVPPPPATTAPAANAPVTRRAPAPARTSAPAAPAGTATADAA